jgi:hypothetical protein
MVAAAGTVTIAHAAFDQAVKNWPHERFTGHSLKTVHRILERYLVRTRGLAEEAIFNLENSPRTKFANQLQTVIGPKPIRKEKSNA